jgi:hypothetical protein
MSRARVDRKRQRRLRLVEKVDATIGEPVPQYREERLAVRPGLDPRATPCPKFGR